MVRSTIPRKTSLPMTTSATETQLASPFSLSLMLSRSVLPQSLARSSSGRATSAETLLEELQPSRFRSQLAKLNSRCGKSAASLAKRREVLDALGSLVFARMGMHRSLFRPQWDAQQTEDVHYDSKFRPLDLTRDVLFHCSVVGDEVVAVVERKNKRVPSFILTRTVRFPVRYMVDDGESLMWGEAAALMQKRRAMRDAADAQFDSSEAEVQAFLAIYSAVAR